MRGKPDLAVDNPNLIMQSIRQHLDALPTWHFTKHGLGSRNGAQRLAVSVICGVAFEYGLSPEPEFETRYIDKDGEEQTGRIDVVIYEPNRYLGLLLAVEVVTDRVKLKDLLKLRDAPMTSRGRRLLIQLNPYIPYPIVRPLALTPLLTESQAQQIILVYYRRGCRTLLDRRKGAVWAKQSEQAQRQRDRIAIV